LIDCLQLFGGYGYMNEYLFRRMRARSASAAASTKL
jgi:hypothetical protein